MVSEMLIDFNGVLTSKTFYEAVIESKARVTYGEAQEIIDGQTIEKLAHVQADILRAKDLAKILMAKRFRDGSLDLDIPEVQILLDGQGNPTDLIRSERLFAHRLIEELMLAANISVAEFFQEKDLPGVYRIHEPPNPDAIMMLERYLWNFGSKTPLGQGLLQKRLTKVLQEFENTPHAQILNILTLRSMSQAKYSANNVGHFGLGFANYSHFTSPIRRYPDLIAHRILKSQLYPNRYGRLEEDDLQTACTLLSACEQRAVKSERQFVSIKKARFMQKHVGEEFDGVISSVVKFGVFVLLRQFEVDGLVRLEQLAQERLEYDDEHLLLRGRRSGVTYRIGDIVKIKVADVNIQDGKIDFEFVEKIEDAITVEDALKNFADMPAHLKSFGQKQKSERESKGGFGNRNQKGNSRNQKNRNNRGGKNKSFSGQKAKGSDDNSFRGFGKQKAKDSDNNNFRGNNKNQKSFKGKSKHQSSNNNQRDQDNNPYRRNDSKNQNRVSGFRTDSKSAGRSPQKSNEIIEFEKPGQSNSEKPIKLTFEKPHKLTFEKPDKAGRSKFKKRGGVKALFKRKK
jgi:ribonuclease R